MCNTCKLLVAISPGAISFVPELLGGTVSDEVITEKCEILDLIILWQIEALILKSYCPPKEQLLTFLNFRSKEDS